ncbi:MAG TPA: oxidoreductase [Firmicutes bacterium]|nr:oxidoreductase [Bacillota bacterium]HBT16802.1 oxidoreductase [Bacillota bacterium]
MKKIKVGIIGTGLAWERLHYPAYQELTDQYEVAAVCDHNREVVEDWGQRLGLDLSKDVFTDYRQMLRRPDLQVIDIMVPIPQNHQVAEEVARSGKNIILEKPLGATYEQAVATTELPTLHGIKMMIAENYRYSEEFNLLRQLVQEKKIGDAIFFIYHSTSCFPCGMVKDTFYATEWRQHPEYRGGDILDAAIHDVAGLRHVFGGIKHLSAFGVPQTDEFSPYAAITVNLEFMNEMIGAFSYYPAGSEQQKPLVGLRIFGTKGMIYLENTDCGLINVFYNDGGHELLGFKPKRGYYNELLNFYNALNGTEEISVTPEMEIGDFRTIHAILQSITDQDIVKVDRRPEYAMA